MNIFHRTGFVESAVNQVMSKRMAKIQQMQWSRRGAHLLLQVRTEVLNEDLEECFRAWYPGFRPRLQKAAACPPEYNALDEQDRAQVFELAKRVQEETGETVEIAFVDQGYIGENAADAAEEHGISPYRPAGLDQRRASPPRPLYLPHGGEDFVWLELDPHPPVSALELREDVPGRICEDYLRALSEEAFDEGIL
jgi:hypothetical protein